MTGVPVGLDQAGGPAVTAWRRVLTGMLVPAAIIVIAVLALRSGGHGRTAMSGLQYAGFGLVLTGALSAVVTARAAERTPQWQVAAGTLAAALALGCYRLAAQPGLHAGAPRPALVTAYTTGALLVMASSVHLMLGLPDGRLTRPPAVRPGPPPWPWPTARPSRSACCWAWSTSR